jgi:uncharacterized protein YndB with AHSA1/START domain
MSAAGVTTLHVERLIDAPPADVFDAWTDPEVLRRWWSVDPRGSTPVADVDLRVGGSYCLTMADAGGARRTVRGSYRRVERPRLLEYTWAWDSGDGSPGHESTVIVRFRGEGERTLVQIEHHGHESETSRDAHGKGWNGALDALQERIFTGAPPAS